MKTAAIIALAGSAALATAGVTNTYGPGAGNSFVDNATVSSSIVVADTGAIVSLNSVTVSGLNHTWLGDLTITLTHDDTGTAVDLIAETGTGTFGDSSDLNGDYTWAMSGDDFAAAADAAGGSDIVAGGTYMSLGDLSAFAGEDIAGTWTLSFTDRAGGDSGSYADWSFNATIPTPGALAVAGLGGLVATRRRRA